MKEECDKNSKCEKKETHHEEHRKEFIEIMPLVDIVEEEHEMIMYFEIPGAKAEDVSVEVANRILSVEARSCLVRKGREIVFKRCFQLNSSTDVSKIHAKTEDGVLTLTLPKTEEAKVHKIQVK